MEQLILSCDRALEYPKNIIPCTVYEHTLNALFRLLNDQESRLFQIDSDVCLDFWEFDDQGKGMSALCKAHVDFRLMNRSILGHTYT